LIPLDPPNWLPDSNGAFGAMPYGLPDALTMLTAFRQNLCRTE
jgi:hypothetical protein